MLSYEVKNMRYMNNGFGARTTTAIAGRKIPKKIPKRDVILGKKKEYIWIPMKFDFSELNNA